MAVYKLAKAADSKLERIYEYSLLNFGLRKADAYYKELQDIFEMLAAMPGIGREFRGRRRHEHAEHVIFYRQKPDGILIVQIFHHSENIDAKFR